MTVVVECGDCGGVPCICGFLSLVEPKSKPVPKAKPLPYPGMSRAKAWDAYSGAARALFDEHMRTELFWRMVRLSFNTWWRDYKNARGPCQRITD